MLILTRIQDRPRIMEIKPTDQQLDIINCDLQPGDVMQVHAFAGTGKTSTLIAYAQKRPQMGFLYVAFNKSVQTEASVKFPKNVVTKTAHALAFASHGHRYRQRLIPDLKAKVVKEALELNSFEEAKFVIEALKSFLVSADAKLTLKHVPAKARAYYRQADKKLPDIVGAANKLGKIMHTGSHEAIGVLHDFYLKLYQLSKPCLNFDCILLDEAQDISPVISAIVLAPANRGAKILVGDPHQQIYSFRGALNSMQKIDAKHRFYLTHSFRFKHNVARVANMILATFKNESKRLIGYAQAPAGRKSKKSQYTYIARTNAAVFEKAAEIYRTKRIAFVGGVSGYRLSRIADIYALFAGRRRDIKDGFIRSFSRYGELKKYATAVEDFELLAICKVVESHGVRIPNLIGAITKQVVSEKKAEVLLVTAHKAKGLEWPKVHIAPDFPPFVKNGQLIGQNELEPDEFNLVYVAVTRAMGHLVIDKKSMLNDFIRLMLAKERKVS